MESPWCPTPEEITAYYEQQNDSCDYFDQADTEGWTYEDYNQYDSRDIADIEGWTYEGEWCDSMTELEIRFWEESNPEWLAVGEYNSYDELADWIEKKIECSLGRDRDILECDQKCLLQTGWYGCVQEMKNKEWRMAKFVFFVPLEKLMLDVIDIFEEEAEKQLKQANKLLDFLMYDDYRI